MAIAAAETTMPAAPPRALWNRFPLASYVLRRLGLGLLTVVIASVLIFLAIRVLPGDVAQIVLGRSATPERVAAVNEQLGVGDPLLVQYWNFISSVIRGDLGYSTAGLVQGVENTVGGIVGPALTKSLALAAISMVLFVPIMIVLGLLAGTKTGSGRDTVISVGSLTLSSLPEFLVANLLIALFFSQLGWFPPISDIPLEDSVLSHPDAIILPIATLLLVSLAFGSRMLRASVADVMQQDYVITAQINGFSRGTILRKYVLPNSLVPTVQTVAQQAQYLIAGIIVVETVFNFPGIGNTLVNAISVQDTQQIMVISLILATIYIGINVLADVVCVLLDPKVRTTIS